MRMDCCASLRVPSAWTAFRCAACRRLWRLMIHRGEERWRSDRDEWLDLWSDKWRWR